MARDPRKSNLYTGTGDLGETGLFGGKRVRKDDTRVAAYGTIDELNAALGLAASLAHSRRVVTVIRSLQNELFNIGAELASDRPVRKKARSSSSFQLTDSSVHKIEALIDYYDARVPALTTFVLPGGTQAAAAMHLARTVARRAERDVVKLATKEPVNPAILVYLNRLCDLLFAMARYLNKAGKQSEIAWQKD